MLQKAILSPLLLIFSVSAAFAQVPPAAEVLRLKPQDGHPSSPVITALAIDPEGEFLAAAGDDHLIRIIDLATFSEQYVLRQHYGWVRTLDFRSDGRRLVSAGNDGQVVVWDRKNDWQIKQSMPDAPPMACVRFSPVGGILAAVGFDPQLFLLQPGTTRRPVLECGCNDLRTVAFSDDMRLVVAAGRSGDAHLFDPGTGQPAGHFELHDGRIRDLIFMPGSDLMVSVSEDRKVVVFDSLGGEVLHSIPVPGCKLFTVAALDSTRVAVGGADNLVRIVDISRGTILHSLPGHTGSIAVLKANGKYLFSGGFDATIRRWPLQAILQQPRTVQRPDETPSPKR
ncbi:WD40 repeat domain-containing protein [Roseimaritima ulvae]|uniref:WD domain, G-beta repeat n=1 Tax=Roseimaritima ulvae TaxID=980254 RepID=A0A5B9QTI3_9BACT|nr:WD40 repeat domain-containing protein [Roseimaritima ulvae]QEG41060.1 WD domain, G-beta repeat [Roseimaritima ulvae]